MIEKSLTLNDLNLPSQEKNYDDENYTIIEVDSKTYGIKTKSVLEIVKIMELDYPNRMPSCILGMLKYEQNPVGVIDLRGVFSSERIVYELGAKIIIIKIKDSLSAVVCDRVLDIKKLPLKNIHSLPYHREKDFFDGVYTFDDESVYLLNVENIVDYIEENLEKFEDAKKKYIVNDEASKKVLAERKNFLVNITPDLQTTAALYDRGVSFLINDVKYYINMASVKEFYKVNNAKFIKVPNTKDFIFGLINIKGDYITVLDIRRFYNNSKTKIKEKSTIIILNSDEYKLGILADEICESMNVDFDEILQNRLNTLEEDKMMEFVKDGDIYRVLDVEKLFKDDRLNVI